MSAPPEAIRDALLEVFRRTRAAQTTASHQVLTQTAAPGELAEGVAAEAWGRTDALSQASPAKPLYACGPGCSSCCHQPVLIGAAEAIAIAGGLRDTFAPAELVRIGEQLAARAGRVGTPGWDKAWLKERWACAFLARDGRCGIHAWRPVVCRGYHSLSRQACEAWHAGTTTRVPIDRASRLAANGVLHGLVRGCRESGRDGMLYELHSAILFALSDSESAARWARGEKPFPGLWATDPTAPPEPSRPATSDQ